MEPTSGILCALAVALIGQASAFRCPPADQVAPCTCRPEPFSQVLCESADGLEVVQKALANKFVMPVPYLKLVNCNLPALTPESFANVSAERLYINNSNIRYISDNAFVGMENLRFLVLQDDRISEVPTEALKKMPLLHTLSLNGNLITKLNSTSFSGLLNLKHLVLVDNRIASLERGVFSPTMTTLSIARNRIASLNGSVRHLTSLEWLFAGGNEIQSVAGELDSLVNLKLLDLSANQLTSVAGAFKDLRSLHSLDLAYNWIEKVDNCFSSLVHLRHLNLSNNHIARLGEATFQNLTWLQTLDLSGNFLSELGTGLNYLKRLTVLNLSRNSLTGIRLEEIKWMKDLRELDLSRNQIATVDGAFGHYVSKITDLKLSDNLIKHIHSGIHFLHHLTFLDLSYNSMATLDKRDLIKNRKLKRIDMTGNPWECDYALERVLQDLETRMVRIQGRPDCYPVPDRR